MGACTSVLTRKLRPAPPFPMATSAPRSQASSVPPDSGTIARSQDCSQRQQRQDTHEALKHKQLGSKAGQGWRCVKQGVLRDGVARNFDRTLRHSLVFSDGVLKICRMMSGGSAAGWKTGGKLDNASSVPFKLAERFLSFRSDRIYVCCQDERTACIYIISSDVCAFS